MADALNIDISKLTPQQLAALQSLIETTKKAAKPKALADRICELPPEEAKDVLCEVAKDITNLMATKNVTWPRIVLNSIKKQMAPSELQGL